MAAEADAEENDMKLIADSGSTKTDWCAARSNTDFRTLHTDGINPFHQSEEQIHNTICNKLLPKLTADERRDCSEVWFYGAGCLPVKSGYIIDLLSLCFPTATVHVDTDLLGAARAVCGHEAGIACILGTGSNSCLYDGERILKNVPPLGYILGDEGSGAYIGKRFISDCLKGLLPTTIKKAVMAEYGLSQATVLEKVYRQPEANKFLSSVVPYIYKVRKQPEVAALLNDCFSQFFVRNVKSYGSQYTVSFTGSVAWLFQEEIMKAAASEGLTVGKFVRKPIDGIREHLLNEE